MSAATPFRRALAAFAVALLVVAAGCAGAGAGAPGDGTTPGDGGNSADPTDDGAGGSAATWERFAFRAGEHYEFEAHHAAEDETATITWDVVAVDGGRVTADVTYDDGTTRLTKTVSGRNATVVSQLATWRSGDSEAEAEAGVRAMAFLSLGPFNPMTAYFTSRDLRVGNSWKLAGNAEAGYATANVEGTDAYAGKDCYVTSVRVPDDPEWESSSFSQYTSCVAPDVGLSLYSAYYDGETGELAFEVTLTDYRR